MQTKEKVTIPENFYKLYVLQHLDPVWDGHTMMGVLTLNEETMLQDRNIHNITSPFNDSTKEYVLNVNTNQNLEEFEFSPGFFTHLVKSGDLVINLSRKIKSAKLNFDNSVLFSDFAFNPRYRNFSSNPFFSEFRLNAPSTDFLFVCHDTKNLKSCTISCNDLWTHIYSSDIEILNFTAKTAKIEINGLSKLKGIFLNNLKYINNETFDIRAIPDNCKLIFEKNAIMQDLFCDFFLFVDLSKFYLIKEDKVKEFCKNRSTYLKNICHPTQNNKIYITVKELREYSKKIIVKKLVDPSFRKNVCQDCGQEFLSDGPGFCCPKCLSKNFK